MENIKDRAELIEILKSSLVVTEKAQKNYKEYLHEFTEVKFVESFIKIEAEESKHIEILKELLEILEA